MAIFEQSIKFLVKKNVTFELNLSKKKKKLNKKLWSHGDQLIFMVSFFFVGKNEKARLDISYFLSDFRSATSIKEKCDLYSKNSLKKQS